MKEGISYSFLLNIIILFIFVCAAIVMGVFSYYRAFRANTIIVNTIEKYEGYNCYSQEEIARKLSTISYSLPYNVACADRYGKHCTPDPDKNYVVVAYNLDNDGFYDDYSNWNEHDNNMFSYIEKDSNTYSTRYQYGVYTYMYVDLPVISKLIRLSYFSKTKEMTEFRNLVRYNLKGVEVYSDINFIPSEIYDDSFSSGLNAQTFYQFLGEKFSDELLRSYESHGIRMSDKDDSRTNAQYGFEGDSLSQAQKFASPMYSPDSLTTNPFDVSIGCHTHVDYSKF